MAWEEPRKTGMQYRRLGSSGLHVSVLGLGGWLTFGGHVENGMNQMQLNNNNNYANWFQNSHTPA